MENASPFVRIWQRNMDLDVEPASALDSVVDQVNSIGGSHNDYLIGRRETIHFAEELIDGRGSLMGISEVVQSAAQSIDFVNEDDTSVGTSSSLCE